MCRPRPSSSALATLFPPLSYPSGPHTLYSTHPTYQSVDVPTLPCRLKTLSTQAPLRFGTRPRPLPIYRAAYPQNTAEIRPLSLAGPLERGTNVTHTAPSFTSSAPPPSSLHNARRSHPEGSLADNHPQTSSLPQLLITSWLRPNIARRMYAYRAPAPHPGMRAAQSAAGSCCSTGYQGSSTRGARSAGRPPEAPPEPGVAWQSEGGVGAPSGRVCSLGGRDHRTSGHSASVTLSRKPGQKKEAVMWGLGIPRPFWKTGNQPSSPLTSS